MLQVNIQQISIKDCAHKYNFRLRKRFDFPYDYDLGTQIHIKYDTGEVTVSTEGAGEHVYVDYLSILFDMIQSKDVIKVRDELRCGLNDFINSANNLLNEYNKLKEA